jgi:hypothetical protein
MNQRNYKTLAMQAHALTRTRYFYSLNVLISHPIVYKEGLGYLSVEIEQCCCSMVLLLEWAVDRVWQWQPGRLCRTEQSARCTSIIDSQCAADVASFAHRNVRRTRRRTEGTIPIRTNRELSHCFTHGYLRFWKLWINSCKHYFFVGIWDLKFSRRWRYQRFEGT